MHAYSVGASEGPIVPRSGLGSVARTAAQHGDNASETAPIRANVQAAKRNEILERYSAHVERFDAMARDRRRRLGAAPRLAVVEVAPKSGISARELAVLELIADGMPNVEIATRLLISEETVKSHVRSVLAKLRAHNRAHAVAIGLGLGLIPLKHRSVPEPSDASPIWKRA